MSWSCLLKFRTLSIISTQMSLWIFHGKSLKCAFTEILSSEADKQERSDLVWSSRSTRIGDLIRVISAMLERIWEHKDSFASSFFFSCQFIRYWLVSFICVLLFFTSEWFFFPRLRIKNVSLKASEETLNVSVEEDLRGL